MTFEIGDLVIVTGTPTCTERDENKHFKPGTVCVVCDIEGVDYLGDRLDWFSGKHVSEPNYRIVIGDSDNTPWTWTTARNLQLAYAAG